ncbi:MAG: type II secretion system protein [Edaphobacter sp.]|uniref:type IV pilin protein n=1 Tax=Edaphobacter sp. TaxID=1934404 RepID=UPI0023879141|nr:type II secretion system protein [Edaphobacter sp.]MDE1178423.1 type II secretion system protein [Edaphobacter sp.]
MDQQTMMQGLKQEMTQREEGFTLIELLIVMSVMLILMTLAVPQMLKLTKQAHETSAIQSVRTIVQAELQYNSMYPQNGFSCALAQLGGDPKSGAPSAQAAQLLAPDLAGGTKGGYAFAVTNCNKVTVNNQDMYTSYEVTAIPLSVGKSGDRGFCSDENNRITYDPAGGTNCTQPIQ